GSLTLSIRHQRTQRGGLTNLVWLRLARRTIALATMRTDDAFIVPALGWLLPDGPDPNVQEVPRCSLSLAVPFFGPRSLRRSSHCSCSRAQAHRKLNPHSRVSSRRSST